MIITPADANPSIAIAIGRFSQSCNYLESQLVFIITRLLPITTDIGRVLLAGNQMRRNIQILRALTNLPEVPISEEARSRLAALIPRLTAINDDRTRFLHNPMMGGWEQQHGEPAERLMLIIDKQDGQGSVSHELTVSLIDEKTVEAKELWSALYINPVEYDLKKWSSEFSQYGVKPYPVPTEPTVRSSSRSPKRKTPRNDKGSEAEVT